MLKSLSISNYALIRELEIEFFPGFSIITGETGAGKSILLGALSLVLGQRADTGVLKNKDTKCVVEVQFIIRNQSLEEVFAKHELDFDQQCFLRREILPSGKSRAFINDTPVNLPVIKEVGAYLVDIHSQHENLNLNDNVYQLNVVDNLAGNSDALKRYQNEYDAYLGLKHELQKLKAEAEKNKSEQDYLQFQFDQLEEAALTENEQEELEKEQEMLQNAGEIKERLMAVNSLMENGEVNVLGFLKDALSNLGQVSKVMESLPALEERLNSAYIELKDIAAEIGTAFQSVDVDPARLELVNDRLDLIYSLQKKHQVNSVKELLDIQLDLEQKLVQITNYEQDIENLQFNLSEQEDKVKAMARELSDARKQVAPEIEGKIIELLMKLGMPNASFSVDVKERQELDEHGLDEVFFLFSANKNISMQDISKVASGGELSRLMLCIKYLMSRSVQLPSIIFDEIDTGVSGEIAGMMGSIMHSMAKNLQLINITHLPQIAAKGSHHYLVFKTEADETRTNIKLLGKDDRVNELAKMLSGQKLSDAAIENARVLLNQSH